MLDQRAQCSRCAQWPLLRKDGTVRAHRALSNVPELCPGTGRVPILARGPSTQHDFAHCHHCARSILRHYFRGDSAFCDPPGVRIGAGRGAPRRRGSFTKDQVREVRSIIGWPATKGAREGTS